MRHRALSLFVLLFFAVPVGLSLSGCAKATQSTYCSGTIGPRVGDVQSITLNPTVGGLSMSFAQTQNVSTPSATDCKSNAVSVTRYTYSTVDPNNASAVPVADVNPTTGQLCAGTWNRNTPGGVADYTFCTSTGKAGTAELTASAAGANSNKVIVYVHPQITAITLGTASTNCTTDPASNCFCGVAQPNGTIPVAPNCYSAALTTTAPSYSPNSCLSFGTSAQLVARFYAGSQNITYSAGHANFTAQTAGLVTFEDTSGTATAVAPGTTVVTANIAQTVSTAGLISVCPPKTITISTANAVNGNVIVNPNTTEPLTAVVTDTNGVSITGLTLTVNSTNPIAIPASSQSITPSFPGVAGITAVCLPPTCNPSPYGNVGLLGTGKPVTSNTITTTTPGSNSTRLWAGSTDSKYIVPIDLTTSDVPSPVQLPYTPNSMIMAQNGQTIFMGSDTALMSYSTQSNGVVASYTAVQGNLLAVSPDSLTTVVSDSNRKLITIFNSSTPAIVSQYSAVGTRAAYTPDGTTLYVATNDNRLLVYSAFTSWQSYDLSAAGTLNDLAIAVPSVGAFVTGTTAINTRSYCPSTNGGGTTFFPQMANTTVSADVNDRAVATSDGRHLLDVRLAASGGTPILNDVTFPSSSNGARTFTGVLPTDACPVNNTPPTLTTAVNTAVLTGVTTPQITGILATTDAKQAFATYLPVSGAATTGAVLPVYTLATSGPGTVSAVTLKAGATAPVVGVLSQDNKFFFAGTSGDNQIHQITRATLTDTTQLNPKLPSLSSSGSAVPNLLVQYPRTVTNQ